MLPLLTDWDAKLKPDGLHPLNVGGVPSTAAIPDDLFSAAVTSTRMAMVLADPNLPDCPVIYCNQAFLDLTGYPEAEVVGRNCRFLQGRNTDPATVRRIREALAARQDVHEEILNYRKDGSHFWNGLQINAIVDGDDRLRFFFASQKDVTRQRETVFRQGQRMESLGALASGIAHQVNNLLTVVVGSVEAAARTADERQSAQLRRADWAARRTGELAGALLAMARRQAADESPVDVNLALEELRGSFAQVLGDGVDLDLELAPTPAVARVDPVQMDLVIANLLRNARDAKPRRKSVALRTRIMLPTEAADLLGVQSALEISVVDTGEGMQPEVASRATEAFFTTKDRADASGLGLFVALSFAEQSGGRLLLDTEPGQGTTVRLVLPREGA